MTIFVLCQMLIVPKFKLAMKSAVKLRLSVPNRAPCTANLFNFTADFIFQVETLWKLLGSDTK